MKLTGVKVVDLSMFLPGPHFTMMMADHGAEVIRVEPFSGEPVRQVGLRKAGHSVWFRNTHRGKKSLRLNLKDPRGKELLLKLLEGADVVVEGFRPGVMERLGLDYEA
ncbi:MAG TPA: CoA transferase, partial [Gammaproteobacteria bacterium]|nr:CoA transferase [Gammaproteobacteria bacterium]